MDTRDTQDEKQRAAFLRLIDLNKSGNLIASLTLGFQNIIGEQVYPQPQDDVAREEKTEDVKIDRCGRE